MNRYKSNDIAKGHTIIPSHHPMPGIDDQPIDASAPDPKQKGGHAKSQKDEKDKFEPGLSPSMDKNRLF